MLLLLDLLYGLLLDELAGWDSYAHELISDALIKAERMRMFKRLNRFCIFMLFIFLVMHI